ncbi:MAG: aldo/keto reductase [Rhodomicrobium sp.]|nr:MAG: aldo/keto reductase [Rhodomicrobium sp.]
MKYTTLGQTDINISRICLGTMTWGNQNTESEGHSQMDMALDMGVNFWDTAEMYAVPPTKETYGSTESIIGSWFKKTGRRDEVILASKLSPEMPYIRTQNRIDRPSIIDAVESSLKRLQTEYIDLYQLHWPTNRSLFHFNNVWSYKARTTNWQEVMDNQLEVVITLNELIKAGKIRQWGLSNDSAWGITQYANIARSNNLLGPVSVQNEYSLLRRRDELNIAEACLIEGISYLPWSPLAMGVLSGKYLGGQTPNARITLDEPSQNRYGYRLTENVEAATRAYVEIAKSNNIDPCQMAIAYCLTHPFITSPIIGASTLEQLETNIKAIDVELSDDVNNAIEAVHKQYPMPF